MVTMIHRGGCGKQVEYLGVVSLDGRAAETALIKWPLGEVFSVSLETGHIQPEPNQSPRTADWRADDAALVLMRRDARRHRRSRPRERVQQSKAA